jgi:C1A family cysteine protease
MSLLETLLSGLGLDDGSNMELTANSNQARQLPPAAKGLCKDKSGMPLVICQRYIETLPTSVALSGGRSQSRGSFQAANLADSPTGSGYNFYMISKYATRVQNQGAEGACTAFGNAHVLGVIARTKGKNGEFDAWSIWRNQGQQPDMDSSLAAAKRMNFDGMKIKSAREFSSNIQNIKRQLDSGRPVYFGSDVDSSWDGANRAGKISCGGGSTGGHAYAIMGYDDASQQLIIKNSWGDSWGDRGYAYLKYSCIGRMGWENAYDIQLE